MAETNQSKAQMWYCEGCDASGTVIDPDQNSTAVIYAIINNHQEKSPKCEDSHLMAVRDRRCLRELKEDAFPYKLRLRDVLFPGYGLIRYMKRNEEEALFHNGRDLIKYFFTKYYPRAILLTSENVALGLAIWKGLEALFK